MINYFKRKFIWNCHLQNVSHSVQAPVYQYYSIHTMCIEMEMLSFWWTLHHWLQRNFLCSQWWKVYQNDNIFIVVYIQQLSTSLTLPLHSYFLAATKQLYKWYFPSVCLSVCLSVRLSVCHTFFTMFPSSYHHEIFRTYYHGQKWCPCKRSRSEVKGQGHRGQHPT